MREVQQHVQGSELVIIAALTTGFAISVTGKFIDVGVLPARIVGQLVQLAHRGEHRLKQQ